MTSLAVDAHETHTVHFSIDGGWLTNICRDFVLEGKWRHALATLTEGLAGISTDQALSILRGQYRLEGVNSVEMVEDNTAEAAEYLETLAWQYAGLWHRPGIGEFLPYALVTHLSSEDVPDFPRIPLAAEKWNTARILYYADDSAKDICTDIALEDSGVGIIWRKVEDPPLWLRGSVGHSEAIDAFNAAGRWLERRGSQKETPSYWKGPTRPRRDVYGAEPDINWKTHDRLLQSSAQVAATSAADDLAAKLGFTGRMADAVHAILDPIDDRPPEPDADLCAESGYVLPDGTFYGCPYMHHAKLAHRLLSHLYKVEVEDPQKEADRRNWLRIQASVTGSHLIMSPKGRPTKRQEKTLASWCIKHEVPYPEDLRD